MKILVACEYSGTVRDAFIKLGYDAISCDLLPTDRPGNHYQGDVFDIINDGFDLMIAHPPCTYLTNAGVRWLHSDPTRWPKMVEGANFFKSLLEADIPYIAVENPIMHKYAVKIIGRRQDQVLQPYMFGHKEKKSTCLWLKGLPQLTETNNVKKETDALPIKEQQRIFYTSPSKDRWKIRSTTFQGIADAMAAQWSEFLLSKSEIKLAA
jgi:hypothetical protein